MRLRYIIIPVLLCLLPLQANQAHAREMFPGPVSAKVIKVRDGDSVDVAARVWPGHIINVSVRLRGIDAPEMRGKCRKEREQAKAAKKRLQELLSSGDLRLTQISGGKYFGRVLAVIKTDDGLNVQKVLLSENLVRPYSGRKRKSWCLAKTADNS